ncbi:Linear gramicidin dehydrogenase LgrE [Planctopirus ephydatiae]|uniref:Linear gramicidin dehydrogenase LgrE n=1 Tax=Planctopirus ephydatiae TaxID=2528019 RepID=A0A518GTG6_9PLAN|nr:Linear gramicidin dehydrogenase LgrE [Planctopirus ephydatiae]
MAEAACRGLVDLAGQVTTQLLPWLDRPFVFFGHSFGALLAFEVTRQLRRRGSPLPSKLIVAAFCSPEISLFRQSVSQLGNEELLHWLRETGGEMDKPLANLEWQDLLLPTLRADLEAIEGYRYTTESPLECPITAFVGRGDKIAPWNQMIGWRRQTSGSFNFHVIDGQHLFLRTAHTPLINIVRKELPALS